MENILSLNPIGHDTSACLMIKGEVVAACEQERYTGDKHSRIFPIDAIKDCLNIAGKNINDIDLIAIPWNIKLMVREFYFRPALENDSRLSFFKNDIQSVKQLLDLKKIIKTKLKFKNKIEFFDHHQCHLAASFYSSGFKDPLVISYDGAGEIDTMAIGAYENNILKILKNPNPYPNSLGLLYSAVTSYLGWKYACDEGIVMGLASIGDPNEIIPGQNFTYLNFFEDAVITKKEFEIELKMPEYLNFYEQRDVWVGEKFLKILGKKRKPNSKITKHHANIAAALQKRLETIIIHHLRIAKKLYKKNKLCISGGVGLNCTLNGKILDSNLFDEIFVVPPSGDSGVVLGACYLANEKNKNTIKKRDNFYLGSRFNNEEVLKELKKSKLSFKYCKNVYDVTSKFILDGKIIGWFQGATEFGPRALGNRSILTKPFPYEMKDFVNTKVKFRESFRPFAPAILEEFKEEYFSMKQNSPHMLIAFQAKKDKLSKIAATVHDDNSSRVQSVSKKSNLRFYNLLRSFYKISNVPVLLNTSFNIKGQPIVNSPKEAIDTFKNTNIDILVIHDYIVTKDKSFYESN